MGRRAAVLALVAGLLFGGCAEHGKVAIDNCAAMLRAKGASMVGTPYVQENEISGGWNMTGKASLGPSGMLVDFDCTTDRDGHGGQADVLLP